MTPPTHQLKALLPKSWLATLKPLNMVTVAGPGKGPKRQGTPKGTAARHSRATGRPWRSLRAAPQRPCRRGTDDAQRCARVPPCPQIAGHPLHEGHCAATLFPPFFFESLRTHGLCNRFNSPMFGPPGPRNGTGTVAAAMLSYSRLGPHRDGAFTLVGCHPGEGGGGGYTDAAPHAPDQCHGWQAASHLHSPPRTAGSRRPCSPSRGSGKWGTDASGRTWRPQNSGCCTSPWPTHVGKCLHKWEAPAPHADVSRRLSPRNTV